MAKKIKFVASDRRPAQPRATRSRRNRIYELTAQRKWTYADVAEKVREIAQQRNDKKRAAVHEITINRLATGSMQLTQDWMETLGEVYSVSAAEIISTPQTANLRKVQVCVAFKAGEWLHTPMLPEHERYDVMVPQDPNLIGVSLYAGEMRGPEMNLRYSENSIVILSRLEQKPGEIAEGRRYHVRTTNNAGEREETIRMLVKDTEGRYWLKPDSTHPEHQAWCPLDGKPGITVELVGRVRGVFFRED